MTPSDVDLTARDPLARAFLLQLRAVLPAGTFEEQSPVASSPGEPRVPVARIPAESAAVGDLLVYSDGTELTAFIGDHTHEHTGTYLFGAPSDPTAVEQAAAAVAAWVRDLLADRIVVWSRRTAAGQARAGGTQTLDSPTARPGLWRHFATEAWLWSGRPFPYTDRSPDDS